MNIFEVATREGFRFPYKGNVSVEDLWQLDLESLDSIFENLSNESEKSTKKKSLLNKRSVADTLLDVKIDIVKHIVEIKLAEASLKLQEKVKKEQKQKIMEILSNKKEESLINKTEDELMEMLKELDNN